ncbi:tRNA pseudouridine(55) synthase TruB [Sulfuricystis multivorans]|uniref:tRNA pseudouridine(55) synthase TruB n=1 Tax=Sulfuricystis multivorans TaxID=2211108 RepID=UPI000F8388C4|nr:tRNA pseudouridine(55) synthase TruB [Sulfuricystis multivorans]
MSKPRRAPRRHVDGVLLLDKPAGLSSNDALQRARRLFNAEKAGHTGTLDPLATGLLPLCFGEATKFAGSLLDADKTYRATVRLGIVTSTADAEGEVLASRPVMVDKAQVMAVLQRFTGEIKQVPPMYSALKRDGRPLYELARQGVEVERAARRVTIHTLRLLDWLSDRCEIEVTCSKGTYIRTLAADIGTALGCGAHLAALRRTRVGALDIATAVTLDAIEGLPDDARDRLLLPVDALLIDLPPATLTATEAARLLHGQTVRWLGEVGQRYRLVAPQGFIGTGVLLADGWLKPQRLIASG